MNELKLKPCPFCGGEAKLHKRLNKGMIFPQCKNTRCIGHNMTLWFPYKHDKEAIAAWNRRANEARLLSMG